MAIYLLAVPKEVRGNVRVWIDSMNQKGFNLGRFSSAQKRILSEILPLYATALATNPAALKRSYEEATSYRELKEILKSG